MDSAEITIDFGTTRTKVAHFDPKTGRGELIKLGSDNPRFIPSVFYVGKVQADGGEILVGADARQHILEDPLGIIFGLKLDIDNPRKITVGRGRPRVRHTELLTRLYTLIREVCVGRHFQAVPEVQGVAPSPGKGCSNRNPMVVNYSITPILMSWFVLALSILVFTPSVSTASPNHIQNVVISSGDYQSPYYDVSSYIAEKLNNSLKNSELIVIESDGSNENIQNLYSRYADFAVCQRNILLDNSLNKESGVKNFQVLLPLFREQLNIRVKSSQSLSIEEFGAQIKDGKISSLGVTSRDGYSFLVFVKLAKFLNIDIGNLKVIEDNTVALHDQLMKTDIQAVATFSYPHPDFESTGSRVYFDEKTIDFLLRFTPNLTKVELGASNSGKYTLGGWAFLVGLDPSIRAVEKGEEAMVTELLSSSGRSNSFS